MQIAWDQKDGRTFLLNKIKKKKKKKKKIETIFTVKYF